MGRAGLGTWHAVVLPCHSHGPLLGCGLRLAVHGGLRSAGPWTADWSTVDRVHHSFLGHGLRATGSCAGGRRGGCSPVSPTVVLLPAASLLVSLRGGASAQLTRVEAPPSLGVFVGGVNVACGVPWCAGHGGGFPGTTAASRRWLRPQRGVSVVRVSFTRLLRARWCSSAALAASGGSWPRARRHRQGLKRRRARW